MTIKAHNRTSKITKRQHLSPREIFIFLKSINLNGGHRIGRSRDLTQSMKTVGLKISVVRSYKK